MTVHEIIAELKKKANPRNVAGMARFGISSKGRLGISVPTLRALAKKIGKNHAVARELWNSGIAEARIVASMVAEPEKLSSKEMDLWIKDFDSWDVCDQVCMNLFRYSKFAWKKAVLCERRKSEFERRAAFSLMAALAVHDKKARDAEFIKLFPLIARASADERNYVKKAVNWALRQIGKRNAALYREACRCAETLSASENKSARWVGSSALSEFQNEKIIARLKKKNTPR